MVEPRSRGYSVRMFGRWKRKGEKHRANKQQGDPGALDRAGDPRGGLQDETYRTADPTDVVEAEGVAMSGPGGAPQEGTSPDERRDNDR
jgi:hypothetical protein